jgi:hypothetical protein
VHSDTDIAAAAQPWHRHLRRWRKGGRRGGVRSGAPGHSVRGGAVPRARGGRRAVLLRRDADGGGASGRCLVGGAALRPAAGLQALHQELPPRGRRRRRGGLRAGGERGVRPARQEQPRAPRDPRRRAAGDQLPDRRRQAPPVQLPVGDHRARGGGVGRRTRSNHQRDRVLRRGRAGEEHDRGDAHIRGHHHSLQPPVAGADGRAARKGSAAPQLMLRRPAGAGQYGWVTGFGGDSSFIISAIFTPLAH